jgi:spermidine synthase
LRHPRVSYCRLVEIDGKVVEGCRRHIPQTAAALEDPRVEVTIGDGVEYVSTTDDRYDMVVVDSSDPVGPAKGLFGSEFYSDVRRILTDDGVVVTQANSPFFEIAAQKELLEILAELFPRVHLYNYTNMTYPGGLYSFSFASKGNCCPVGDLDARRVAESGLTFEYYSDAVHRAAFALPEFQRRALHELLTPFR